MNQIPEIYNRQNLSFARLRTLFYIVTPNETTFENPESVPDYISEALPWFLILIALEILYSTYKKKNLHRINDSIISLSSGMLQQAVKLIFHTLEFTTACWVYENYGFHFLNWDSIWTWIVAFVLVDFTYYWFHRGAHEINFFWAFHQMHHSSEEYNLTTALRQGMFQPFLSTMYNLPEALILPPSVHIAHLGLNKINQFWVHTQAINRLGPLEHILVTPSHHRVHHGRNPYCIDKNYSGTFIIWDKLFGTFQAEKEEEPVIFGLVHNVNSFDALYCQHVFLEKMLAMKTCGNKLKAIFYGPGWHPGTPRMGNMSEIPEVKIPFQKYDIDLPKWMKVYLLLHLNITNIISLIFVRQRDNMTFGEAILYAALITFSVHCLGWFLDNKPYAPHCELVRVAILYYWFFNEIYPPKTFFSVYVNIFFCASFAIWLVKVLWVHWNKKAKTD